MARKLTINERKILVDRAYNEIRTESIPKLESEMHNNPVYHEIIACRKSIEASNEEIEILKAKIKKLQNQFNEDLNNDNFEYNNEYSYHYNGNFKWEDKGLRNKIETEVVLANLGDSVDFEKLIASLKDQFGA